MSCPQTFANIPTDQRELCERGCTVRGNVSFLAKFSIIPIVTATVLPVLSLDKINRARGNKEKTSAMTAPPPHQPHYHENQDQKYKLKM